METRQTTDSDLVFEILVRLSSDQFGYYPTTSDEVALVQDWDWHYSHGQDETHV